MNTNYELNISTAEFNETYNKIDETYNLQEDISGDMLDSEILGADESWSSSVKNSYKGVRRSVSGSFGLVITIVQELSKTIGIPSFVITLALTAIGIAVVFSFIYMIFRFKG